MVNVSKRPNHEERMKARARRMAERDAKRADALRGLRDRALESGNVAAAASIAGRLDKLHGIDPELAREADEIDPDVQAWRDREERARRENAGEGEPTPASEDEDTKPPR
jgi:hypothetical protein